MNEAGGIMNAPLLRMENIHKWFEKVHALKGVDFEVNAGEVVALIGDNGAGKSTLMHILVGFVTPNKGKIYLRGKEVNIYSPSDARKLGIEMVYQDTATIGSMSVMQNIFLDREKIKSIGPIKIIDKKKMKNESEKLTKILGLRIASPDQEVRFCSGGERQGIAISRAMYFKAKVVILDEPIAALSIKGAEKVMSFMRELKNKNIAVIIIVHDLSKGYSIADRFVILSLGRKIADIRKKETSIDELRDVLVSS